MIIRCIQSGADLGSTLWCLRARARRLRLSGITAGAASRAAAAAAGRLRSGASQASGQYGWQFGAADIGCSTFHALDSKSTSLGQVIQDRHRSSLQGVLGQPRQRASVVVQRVNLLAQAQLGGQIVQTPIVADLDHLEFLQVT